MKLIYNSLYTLCLRPDRFVDDLDLNSSISQKNTKLKKYSNAHAETWRWAIFGGAIDPTLSAPEVAPTLSAPGYPLAFSPQKFSYRSELISLASQ